MDDVIARGFWVPTKDEMRAYREREVELCVHAMKRTPTLKHEHTLFSFRTWELARLTLMQQRKAAA